MGTKKGPCGPFLSVIILLPSPAVETTVMFEPRVVKTFVTEVSSMLPLEVRTVVFKIEAIPVVTVPGGIVIVGISGEIGFADGRSGVVSASVYGSRCVCAGVYNRRSDIDPW